MNEIRLRSNGTVKVMDGKKVLFDGTMDDMMKHKGAVKGFINTMQKIISDAERVQAKCQSVAG